MRGAYQGALVVLAVALGLYYDAKDQRAANAAPIARAASMPAASVPAAEAPAAAPAIAKRPEVTQFRIGHRNVKTIYADAGATWVGTSDGLIRYDMATEKHERFGKQHGLASTNVFFVGRVDGRIVAATAGGHLSVFDERSRRWSTSAIAGGAVLDLLQTRSGEVWIASLAGVAQVPRGAIGDPAAWISHTSAARPVYALTEGKRGEVWLATERGVARFSRGHWDTWELGAARVLAIKVDSRGYVWAGTWGNGLQRFDGKSWRAYGKPGDSVFTLFDDRRGTLWVGTDKGVARMKNGRLEKALGTDKVFALARSSDDSLWVGGFGGVARVRPAGAL